MHSIRDAKRDPPALFGCGPEFPAFERPAAPDRPGRNSGAEHADATDLYRHRSKRKRRSRPTPRTNKVAQEPGSVIAGRLTVAAEMLPARGHHAPSNKGNVAIAIRAENHTANLCPNSGGEPAQHQSGEKRDERALDQAVRDLNRGCLRNRIQVEHVERHDHRRFTCSFPATGAGDRVPPHQCSSLPARSARVVRESCRRSG